MATVSTKPTSTWTQALAYSVKTRPIDGSKYFLFSTQIFKEHSDGSIFTVRKAVATDEHHKERIAHYLDAIDKKHQPLIPVEPGHGEFWRIDFDCTESLPPEEMVNLAKKYANGPRSSKGFVVRQLPLSTPSFSPGEIKRQSFKIEGSYVNKAEQIAQAQNKAKTDLFAYAVKQYIDSVNYMQETLV